MDGRRIGMAGGAPGPECQGARQGRACRNHPRIQRDVPQQGPQSEQACWHLYEKRRGSGEVYRLVPEETAKAEQREDTGAPKSSCSPGASSAFFRKAVSGAKAGSEGSSATTGAPSANRENGTRTTAGAATASSACATCVGVTAEAATVGDSREGVSGTGAVPI